MMRDSAVLGSSWLLCIIASTVGGAILPTSSRARRHMKEN